MSKFIILFIFGISIAAFADEYRSFTDKDGRTIRAKILKVDTQTKNVTVEREDKREVTVPIGVFSKIDQAYIFSWIPTSKPKQPDSEPVFRDAFTLKLPISKEQVFKQDYPKVPYVIDNDVFIFPGESFRVGVEIEGNEVKQITYDKDRKAEQFMEFNFNSDFMASGEVTMRLNTENKTSKKIVFTALMVTPKSQSPIKTSILPIYAGLMSFEMWPHPILQLILTDFTVVEDKK